MFQVKDMYLIKEINPKTSSPVENSLECWMTVMIMRRMRSSIVWVTSVGLCYPFHPSLRCPLRHLKMHQLQCNGTRWGCVWGSSVSLAFVLSWETHTMWWWEGKEERVCISAWARAANENGGGKKVAGYQSTILTMRKKDDQSNITEEEIWVCSDRFWRSHHKYDVAGKN